MASTLTLTQAPVSLQSAGNDSLYTVSSSVDLVNSGSNYLQYKVTADLYVDGEYATTLKSYPDSQFGFFQFNTRNTINNFLSYDFVYSLSQDTASLFHTGSNSFVNAFLSFGEEYFFTSSLQSSIFVQNHNLATSSTVPYFNGSLSFIDQAKFNLQQYVITGSTPASGKFLTKANFTIPTYANLRNYLYYYASSSVQNYLFVSTFDSNGNNLGGYEIINPYYTYDGIQFVAVGYPQLAQFPTSSYLVNSGNPLMINSQVDSYQIWLAGGAIIPVSEVKTFQVATDCNRFAPYAYQLYWINVLGGFDSWNFNRQNLVTQNKTVSTYKKIPGQMNANGTFMINTYDRNKATFYTSIQDSIQVSTDFITDAQVLYLKGLFSSPVVYAQDPDGNLFACNVSTTAYPIQRNVNNKLNVLSLTIEPAYNDFR